MSITKLNNLSISAVTALPSGVGGKVLQVVTATDTSERSTTSTSYVTGSNTLSASITPSSASNKILIFVSTTIGNTSTTSFTYVTVYRGASNLGTSAGFINQRAAQSGGSFSYLDSPSSTSSLTYQVYFKVEANTGYLVASGTSSSITVMEIAA